MPIPTVDQLREQAAQYFEQHPEYWSGGGNGKPLWEPFGCIMLVFIRVLPNSFEELPCSMTRMAHHLGFGNSMHLPSNTMDDALAKAERWNDAPGRTVEEVIARLRP